jgi:L-amino acid N-acyltransferase YncA
MLGTAPETRATPLEGGTTDLRLRDGSLVAVRRILPGDQALLLDIFRRLSPESRYQRFMAGMATLSASQLRDLTDLDHRDREAWIAIEPGTGLALGVARYIRLPARPQVAEVAVAVVDSCQGLGLGSALLALVSGSAADQGIRTFRAYVFETNHAMLRIFHDLGATVRGHEGDVLSLDVPVPRSEGPIPDTPTGRVFRAIARLGARPAPADAPR